MRIFLSLSLSLSSNPLYLFFLEHSFELFSYKKMIAWLVYFLIYYEITTAIHWIFTAF